MALKKVLKKIFNSFLEFRVRCILKRKKYCIKFYGKTYKKISSKANVTSGGLVKFNHSIYSRDQHYEKGIFVVQENANVNLGAESEFRSGCKLFVFEGASFSIGSKSFVNINSFIECRNKISIGQNTLISRNVTIIDGDTHVINGVRPKASIIIGDNVLIGTNVIILKGVSIGSGAIVGAGSVVTHNIPPRCMAAGNPAKVIKENVCWEI